MVNERRDNDGIPNIVVANSGDDASSAGYYGGDFGCDDVHARLVP